MQFLYILVYALLPIAVGIAMLRYRLYEIDVIIRRTLTYACLVAALAVVYLAGVTLIGAAAARAHRLVGRGRGHALDAGRRARVPAAAPAHPARPSTTASSGRGTTPRQAVDAFSGRLREQIDLDALSAELVAVVRSTVQPTQTTLWLRVPDQRSLTPDAMVTRVPSPNS